MKVYRIDFWTNIAHYIFFLLLATGACFYFIYNKEATLIDLFIFPFFLLFALCGIYSSTFFKVIVLSDRIETQLPLLKIKTISKSVRWVDIVEITAIYYLFPGSAMLKIKSKQETGKIKMTYIPLLGSITVPLMKDILAHIPSTTRVSLYPYLKRKLEGKQTFFYKDS